MDKGIETGKDKIRRICDVLRKETLEPAQGEAEEVIARAHKQAEEILEEARKKTDAMQQEAARAIEEKNNAFEASMRAASRQVLESLKASIEEKLLHPELATLIREKTQDPETIAQLINAVIDALEKEGTHADLSAYIPSAVSADAINALVGARVLERLKEKSVLVAPFAGGIAVKLHKERLTIELTDEALRELVLRYVQKEFRTLFFASKASNE